MIYELDDLDRRLLAKCREGLEFHRNGDPIKDVMDEDDLIEAVEMLVKIVDADGVQASEPLVPECETCRGVGTIDERLGGYSFSNPAATCPDCDGTGEGPAGVALPDGGKKQ